MMNRLRRSFRDSFRLKKKDRLPESSKPHQWIDDEKSVRNGDCHFSVKYLGNVEVSDARGMQVCEEAMNILRASRRKPIKSQLYVTGDGLRVVDDEKRGLIVDQTIEKVSFCAPDRQNERGFSYICRDGTTRRWVLHGFHAVKDSGERLSHAVGCAFAICLEKKQKRDRDLELSRSSSSASQQVIGSSQSSAQPFQRNSSFRQSSILERMKDPQVVKPEVSKPPSKPVVNPYAIERPHATPQLLERQGSFRGFTGLSSASPFKRQLSLRLNELPSNIERQGRFSSLTTAAISNNNNSSNTSRNFNGYLKSETDNHKFTNQSIKSNMFSTAPSTTFSSVDNSLSPFSRVSNGSGTIAPLTNGNSNDSDEKNDTASQYISSIADMCKELTQGLALLSNDESDDLNSNYPPLRDPSSSLSDSSDSHYITAFDNCDVLTSTQKCTPSEGTNLWPTNVCNNNDAIGYGAEKGHLHLSPQKGNFTSPIVTTSINLNSLPTATVAPLVSPAVVTTLSSNSARDTPSIKKQFAPQSGRTSTVDSSSICSNGPHLVRRPVPPPPVSNESLTRSINQSTGVSTKSNTFRPPHSSNSLDLSKVWPASLNDPFDAEWTNLVTKNICLNRKPATFQKQPEKHLILPHDTINTQSETLNQLSSTLHYPPSDVSATNGFTRPAYDAKRLSVDTGYLISTNPFASTDPSNKTCGIRKQFQIDM